MKKRRVGILGGSFDPPTLAHEQVGGIFLNELQLDEVRYVVARQNPLKTHTAIGSTQHRWNMIQMMISQHEKFSASDIEIQHERIYDDHGKLTDCEEDAPSYMYNTLKAFERFEPRTEFILLGGSDILRNFYQWHKAEHIIKEFKLGIAIRPPHNVPSTIAPIREEHRKNVQIVDREHMPDISSTDVRSFFEANQPERAKSLMRHDIYEYVQKNHIYDFLNVHS